VSVRWQR